MAKANKRMREEEQAIAACLRKMQSEIADATGMADRVRRCRRRGDLDGAFHIALDIEVHLHRANTAIQAAANFHRSAMDE